MAYDKNEIEEQALEAIQKYKLIFITDVTAYIDCDLATFYRHECEKCESLKSAISENRIKIKNAKIKRWYDNDNPTTDIALMKLIGTDEERRLLSTTYQDRQISTKEGNPFTIQINYIDKEIE